MAFNEKINQWSKVHVFYNMFTHEPGADAPREVKLEHEWRIKMLNETLNGKLMVENSLFDNLRKSSKIYLVHITPNLNQILESGALYSSGGCLVGGVYAAPIFKENDKFRVHNLGRYLIEEEAPKTSHLQRKEKTDTLIIEIMLPPSGHNNLIGIDYVRLGNIHLDIYRELEYLLSFQERLRLYDILLNRVKHSLAYLGLVNCSYANGKDINPELFFELFIPTIEYLPILGYMYFEVVSEYLMLYEDSEKAKQAHALGEFYNYTYKNLMFDLFPSILTGQSLSIFRPTLKQLSDYIKRKKIISNFNANEMARYLTDRLSFLTNARLLNNGSSLIDWRDLKWDFDTIAGVASPLLGHLVHRELRNFGRYPDFYFYFDQFKALQIWNYWNHMDVIIPFNGFFPKGETGVNPACPDLKYQIYLGRTVKGKSDNLYVEPEKKLNIEINPRLINIKYTTMRSKDKANRQRLKLETSNYEKNR